MQHAKRGPLIWGVIIIVIVFGLSASSANAFEWWINHETLQGKTENMTFAVKTPIEFIITKFTIKCSAGTSTGGFIRNKTELQWTELKLTSCVVVGKEAECTVKNGELPITKYEGELELKGIIKGRHPGGTEFGSFTIEGGGCAVKGAYTLNGSGKLYLRLQEPEQPEMKKIFEIEPLSSTMQIEPGVEAATTKGELNGTAATNKYFVHNAATNNC